MKSVRNGWVIINIGHPVTGKSYVCEGTFSYQRKTAIKDFISNSSKSWRYWRNIYNFRVVRCTQTTTVHPNLLNQ